MRFALVAIFLMLVAGAAIAQQSSDGNAPLGLEWGAGVEQLRSRGAELTGDTDSSFGKAFIFTKLPQALADQDSAIGFFGHDNKLWRLVLTGKPNHSDPYGSATKARYESLVEILSEKYGKPTRYHRMGDSIYAENRYFVSGIRSGRTSWFSNFKAKDLTVQISIGADDGDTSRWRIIYENEALRSSFDRSKKAKEKGAL